MSRGRLITLEGGEGAGKSTQVKRLAAELRALGTPVATTREPGGSDGAEAIRALLVTGDTGRWSPTTEALLLAAARRDHLERTVWPALDAGTWVICDRFADSTTAYQGYGHGLPLDTLATLHAVTCGDFIPDLTLILDLPVEVGLARAAGRGAGNGATSSAEDRFERMDRTFHHRLRDGFQAIAADSPNRCAIIDASAGVDEVWSALWAVVRDRLLDAPP